MESERVVSLYVHEKTMSMVERTIRRLWITIILLIILLVGSNVAWLIYESQFEYFETTTVTQDNENGYNNYIGNDGDITNGTTDSNK